MRINPNDTNQSEQSEQNNQMQPPEAASKRDVEEAERKAEQAEEKADEAQDMAKTEAEQVHAELREEIDTLEEQVGMLDRLVNKIYEIGATGENGGPLNPEMPFVVPENREPEDQDKSVAEVMEEAATDGK